MLTPVWIAGSLVQLSSTSGPTTPSISLTGGDFVIAFIGGRGSALRTITAMSSTHSGGITFTRVDGTRESTFGTQIGYGYGFAGSSPGSGTISWTLSGSLLRVVAGVIRIPSVATGGPISETGADVTGTGATISGSIGGISGGNVAISLVTSRSASGIAPLGSETELMDAVSTGSTPCRIQAQYLSGTSLGVTPTAGDSHSLVLFEVAEALASAFPALHYHRLMRG